MHLLGNPLARLAAAALATTSLCPALYPVTAQSAPDALLEGFETPPQEARPRVWWHWMNGNITKEGIRKDIEWMSRIGIGGMQAFDGALLTPPIVPKRLPFMSPDWRDAFRHAAQLAQKNGLELAIASSPGWSETGGPWVPPQDGMKKLVWSESVIEGGRRFDGMLPAPPTTTGPFQDVPKGASILAEVDVDTPHFYADAAVLAYPMPTARAAPTARMTYSDGAALDAAALTDGRSATGVDLAKAATGQPATTLLIEYSVPRTIRAVTMATALGDRSQILPALEVEEAGAWRKVADIDLRAAPQTTVALRELTARRFRIVFTPKAPAPPFDLSGAPGAFTDFIPTPSEKQRFRLAELRLETQPRVNAFEQKAGFAIAPEYYELDKNSPNDVGIDPASVVDLTSRLSADGKLDWTPPPGRWKVLRLGYSLTGKTNHPATKEATGLEVDKYDRAAVRRYLDVYLGMYAETTGADLIGKHGLRALLTDSMEAGPSNWTPAMVAAFRRLRGYDPGPWLPVLTGTVVGSTAQSDAFLYDFRRTLADLVATEHYETVAHAAHERGMIVYGESLEGFRAVLGSDLTMRRYADIPMAAFWTYQQGKQPAAGHIGDMRGAASVAHVYGRKLVAAESLTAQLSPWAFAPHDLKKFIDMEFANGVNRPVIHTSVHQPLDKGPGFSLAIFGQYFNRLDSWAEMAGPWVDYMSRSSFLLQQGRNVADLAYFIGEEQPAGVLFAKNALGDLPRSYAYDLFDAGMLTGALSVQGADLVTPGGARYRALYLGGTSARMTVPVLRQLADLVSAGATVIGSRPLSSPSLADDPAEFARLVSRLWGGGATTRLGRGQVIDGRDPEAALKDLGIAADFAYTAAVGNPQLLFVHRKLADGDIYFVHNRSDRAGRIDARFRVTGKLPELWHADTGSVEPVSYRIENGQTVVPLDLEASGSAFLVFRKPAPAPALNMAKREWVPAQTIAGSWEVTFQAERGAPPSVGLETLVPLDEHSDPGIRYFSGIATYRTSFILPKTSHGRMLLDLGRVGDLAEVWVNGKKVGSPWMAPFRVDVGHAVRPGPNRLEVRVANLWVNRLIGDLQPGARKITFTTLATYKADAPLRPSGLIGPVRLLTEVRR
ncbi:glycosyl hydrolase [Sphingopyxis sp. MSC1_008]|uniref:glycosyl hydrolase n=1 Tax=Sphingopyxis sp. MSC1_008 TaxID=2909265 RepID=UPI0020BDC48B